MNQKIACAVLAIFGVGLIGAAVSVTSYPTNIAPVAYVVGIPGIPVAAGTEINLRCWADDQDGDVLFCKWPQIGGDVRIAPTYSSSGFGLKFIMPNSFVRIQCQVRDLHGGRSLEDIQIGIQ